MAGVGSGTIRPRAFQPDFDEAVPRHWLAGDGLATQIANGVNLLFPAGERFFIRSVVRYLDRVEDPALRAAVRGFIGQEGHHSQAHERFFTVMEGQGYRIKGLLAAYERLAYGLIEPLSSTELRLATTVALEHFTAILADDVLRSKRLDLAHPRLRELLLWHAAEELEHKAVAFDVLQIVNPGYRLRMAGLVMAVLTLGGFWAAATMALLLQDRRWGPRHPALTHDLVRTVFVAGIKDYLRRDFHPAQRDNLPLAEAYLAKSGIR